MGAAHLEIPHTATADTSRFGKRLFFLFSVFQFVRAFSVGQYDNYFYSLHVSAWAREFEIPLKSILDFRKCPKRGRVRQ